MNTPNVMPPGGLEIPDAAYDTGEEAAVWSEPYVAEGDARHIAIDVLRDEGDARHIATDVLRAAAPLIVAAELRRIAADLGRRAGNVPMSESTERVRTFREIEDHLNARADALAAGVHRRPLW